MWLDFSLVLGSFMSRLILTVIYFSILMPWGIAVRLFSDRLEIKSKPQGSAWHSHSASQTTQKELFQQY